MREFKDEEGRPWRLALTVAAVLRVKDFVAIEVDELDANGEPTGRQKSVPFDMGNIGNVTQTFQILRGQFAKVGEVLYAVLVKQVEERKLSKEEFLDGLRGDSLDAAASALEQELTDFFPPRLRKMVALLAAKMNEVATELQGKAEAALASVTAESLSGTQFGRPQESSASTPESGLSDNSLPPGRAA